MNTWQSVKTWNMMINMAGTSCRGKCVSGSPLTLEHEIRSIRGNVRTEDKGKSILKCGNCQIRIYNYKGKNCPCCNNKMRTANRYKPDHLVHHLEDTKEKIQIPKTVEMKDGSNIEIIKIVVLSPEVIN